MSGPRASAGSGLINFIELYYGPLPVCRLVSLSVCLSIDLRIATTSLYMSWNPNRLWVLSIDFLFASRHCLHHVSPCDSEAKTEEGKRLKVISLGVQRLLSHLLTKVYWNRCLPIVVRLAWSESSYHHFLFLTSGWPLLLVAAQGPRVSQYFSPPVGRGTYLVLCLSDWVSVFLFFLSLLFFSLSLSSFIYFLSSCLFS